MRHVHQDLPFRRGAIGAVSLGLQWGIGLAMAIGIWTPLQAWALTVSPSAVTFQAVQGAADPPNQTINMSKSNKRSTSWIAMDNATWLLTSPGVGTITSEAQIGLVARSAGLAAGTYTATVTILSIKAGARRFL